jgi:hypothetical protein
MKMRVVVSVIVILASSSWSLAQCPPRAVPRNPAPVRQTPASSGSDCLVKVLQTFGLNKKVTRAVTLESGKSYWFAANGCPRMGTIGISIVDGAGKVLKSDEANSPSFCFTAGSSGKYTLRVKALSLTGLNTWGTIDACFSKSGCGE